MPTYVEIAVNVPGVMGVFHYHLPPDLEGACFPGHLVEVPFARQRVQGVVLRFVAEPEVAETRPVIGLIDPEPVLTPLQMVLAGRLAESCLAPLAACIDLMLPPGLWQQADISYSLQDRSPISFEDSSKKELSDIQSRLVDLLRRRGALRGRQIDHAMPHVEWRGAAQGLVRRDILNARSVLPPPGIRPKSVRTVQLACPPGQVEKELPTMGRAGSATLSRRQRMLEFLLREPGPVDVAWAYAESGGSLADLHFLAERGLVILGESEVWRNPLAQVDFVPAEPPLLTRDQEEVWASIQRGLQDTSVGKPAPPFLLHGVTGSGKTEIYLRAVEAAIEMDRQSIVLVPEIALTPQTIRRFVARFPGRVGLYHSGLSAGERYDTWRRARAGLLSVMVGPRSALFTPFEKLGLIILDEFHDDSYYQEEPQPHYHAREAALLYAQAAGALCLLGSATPDVTTRLRAERERWQLLSLPTRILAHRQVVKTQVQRLGVTSRFKTFSAEAETIELPPVRIIDMRQELKQGNRSIFSRALEAALGEVLNQGHQAILFINRRGSATYVFCRACGYILKCPRCDLPLTYHVQRATTVKSREAGDRLVCHHCYYQRQMPEKCPQCGSSQIRHYGTGTERVEAEVHALFPDARLLRWDYETTRQKGAHEIILGHFINHRADILIGTQMIAKGLDIPLVTLVGVVLADVGLSLPDYRTAERTFQVLTQVAGRAGRSPLGGQVILQTFQPEHYVIQAAAGHDYQAFYQQELEYRRRLGYPPFSRLVRLEYRHADPVQAEAAAQELAGQIKTWLAAEDRHLMEIIGPVPCFFGRLAGFSRWQIILRGPDPASLLRKRNLGDWQIEVDPVSLL